jgi:hypothetical protein
MKTRVIRVVVGMVTVTFSSIVLLAQIVATPVFRVDVPFTFMAGGVHLPAGPYIVSRYDPHLIQIEALDSKARSLVYVTFEDTNHHTPTKLVFHNYGGQYFLAQVWIGQHRQVHYCPKCRPERMLEAQSRPSEQIAVLARK